MNYRVEEKKLNSWEEVGSWKTAEKIMKEKFKVVQILDIFLQKCVTLIL